MGSLVIEGVELKARGSQDQTLLRASGGLTLHEGKYERLPELLACVFAGGPAPDLAGATVDFVLNGAAHQWRGDFLLQSCELVNRSTGHRYLGPGEISALFQRELGTNLQARLAAFTTPAVQASRDGVDTEAPLSDPPPSAELAQQLARYEAALQAAERSHETAAALYGDLFPLLEAQEEASAKLEDRVRQLELHHKAEALLTKFKALEERVQERTDAGRKAVALEKKLAAWESEKSQMIRIDAASIEQAKALESDVETHRAKLIELEKLRKAADGKAQSIHSRGWWIVGLLGMPVAAGSWFVRDLFFSWYHGVPVAYYGVALGMLLMLGLAVGVLQSSRRASRRRALRQCQAAVQAVRREVELAELASMQHLRKFAATTSQALAARADEVELWWSSYEAAAVEIQRLRQLSGTDDTLGLQDASESTRLGELEQQCREVAHYRLSDTDRHTVEQMVEELENEARYQKEAAAVLQKQCQELSQGWGNLPDAIEQVSALRNRLAEWQRWERAFRRMREVIDALPDVPSDHTESPEARAALYLERITAGRWTELRVDMESGGFKLHDRDAGLWIHADRENPAVRSTVHLAYRLAVLESAPTPVQLPLWLEEPFDELPEGMAEATAGLLAETARQRQVVLICRQRPAINWPEGMLHQG
jgi:hypothetical protein